MQEITFILVHPSRAENIGAAARAMKTMGFNKLHLVQPGVPLSGKAAWTAHGAEDILENAVVHESLQKSLEGMDFSVGTTTRKRWVKQEYLDPLQLRDLLKAKGDWWSDLAIVFGGEESGLSNEELKQCDIGSTIPMATSYPSLNLSHAVMIYAYELSRAFQGIRQKETQPAQDSRNLKALKEKAGNKLMHIGLPEEDLKHGRILDRIGHMNRSDLNLLQTVLNKL